MSEGGTRKSSRTSLATEKRKAAVDTDNTTDEGSEEQMKKKLKGLEDQIKKLTGTNAALTDTVRVLQKEKNTRRCTNDDRGSDGSEDEDDEDDGDDSPMLFSAQKITVTGRSNPDGPRQKKRQPHGDNANGGVQAPQRQDLPPQHQGQSPSPVPPDPEHTGSPASTRSPTPPSQSSNAPPIAAGGAPLVLPAPPAHPAPPVLPVPAVLPDHPWAPAPLAPGVDPKTPKTANKVYDSIVRCMLTRAQHRFEHLLFVQDAYPPIDMQIRRAIACWEAVCSKSQRYFELSKEMRNLIKGRCSHGRGAVLQRVRPVVDALFNMNTTRASVVQKNAALAKRLLTKNAFYFVDGVQGNRRFENETILRALQRAFFNGPKSCAAINRTMFNPIHLESIAFVCTVIEHCLREWESGLQVQISLDENIDAPRYRTHLANAISWRNLNKRMTDLICKHISGKLFDSCGAKSKPEMTMGLISEEVLNEERSQLEGRRLAYDTEEEV